MELRCAGCGEPFPAQATAGTAATATASATTTTRERREVCVVFCDLGGYTAWNEQEEPEDVVAVMDRIKQRATQIFEAHGGIANQFVGDEVVGLFGITTSHEDDPVRAVSAALALHEFVRAQLSFASSGGLRELRLHTGIETGLVYAQASDPRAGLYQVTGDPVNVAARLRSLAQADQILVGPTTHERVAPFFELERMEPLALRGKSQTIAASRVLRPSTSVSFFDAAQQRGLTPYVGRERELEQLERAWQQARDGHGTVVGIGGAPGIGKTRLLHELRRRVRGEGAEQAFVFHGRCQTYGEVAPYQPFIAAISDWSNDPNELGPAFAQHMPVLTYLLSGSARGRDAALANLEGGERLRDAIVAALVALFTIAPRLRPTVLLFEDWHASDEASRVALRELAQRMEHSRLLLVINYRPAELQPNARPQLTETLELEPLEPAQTNALARRALQTDELPAGVAQLIHERTLGNPFFVEEICRSLQESGALRRDARALVLTQPIEQLRTPATVQAIVRARVDRLAPRHKAVLRMAAVIGSEVSFELLHTLREGERSGGVDAADATRRTQELAVVLDELCRLGLAYALEPAGSVYRFKHAITQLVVYEGLPLDDRRRLHGEVARVIEQRLAPEEVEAQCENLAHHYALSGIVHKGVEYCVLAGEKAWRSFALEQAERQFRRALELHDKVRAHVDEAAACKQRALVSVSWARAGVYNPSAAQVEALRVSAEQAERLGLTHVLAMCLNWMGWIEYARGDQNAAVAHDNRCLELALALQDTSLIAQAHNNLGFSYTHLAEYETALEQIEAGIAISGRRAGTSHGFALGYLALIAGDQGRFRDAFRCLEEARPIAERAGRLTLQGPLLVQRGMVECWRGTWEACVETGHTAYEIAKRIDGHYIYAMSRTLAGYARFMISGDHVGLALLQEAIELLDTHQIRLTMSWNLALFAEALALAGAYREASSLAERALARAAQADRLGEVSALRVQGMIAGHADRDLARAEQHMSDALRLAGAKRSPRETALTQLRWGELLAAAGKLELAAELGAQAMTAFLDMGMTFYADAARRLCLLGQLQRD